MEIAHDMSKDEGMLIMKNEGAYLTIHEGFASKEVDYKECRIVPIFKVKNIEIAREKLKTNGVQLHGDIVETQFTATKWPRILMGIGLR